MEDKEGICARATQCDSDALPSFHSDGVNGMFRQG